MYIMLQVCMQQGNPHKVENAISLKYRFMVHTIYQHKICLESLKLFYIFKVIFHV